MSYLDDLLRLSEQSPINESGVNLNMNLQGGGTPSSNGLSGTSSPPVPLMASPNMEGQPGSPEAVREARQQLVRGPVGAGEGPMLPDVLLYAQPGSAARYEEATRPPSAIGGIARAGLAMVGGPNMRGAISLYDDYEQRAKAEKKAAEEQIRQQLIGDEISAVSGMLESALISPDDKLFPNTIKALAGQQGLQPETVKFLQHQRIQMGLTVKAKQNEDQEEQATAAALAKLSPEYGEIIEQVVKSSGGKVKSSAAMALIKSGIFGEPSKVINTSQGAFRTAPTGYFARNYTGPAGGEFLTPPVDKTPRAPTLNEMALFKATNGRTKVMDDSITPAEAKTAIDLMKSPELTPGAFSQRADLAAINANTRATVSRAMEAQTNLADLASARTTFEAVRQQSEQLITAATGPEAVLQGAMLTGGSVTRLNQAAKLYKDTIEAWRVAMGRTQGHKGVMTAQDAVDAAKSFPDFFDTVTNRDAKNNKIDQLNQLKVYVETELAAGRQVNMDDIQKRSSQIVKELKAVTTRAKTIPPGWRLVPGSDNMIISPDGKTMRKWVP